MAGWGLLTATHAQTSSSSNSLTATPATDRIVPFRLSEAGVTRQVEWGADIAWLDENNVRRSAAFMGKDNLDIVRTSFQATYALVDGDLQQGQKDTIAMRIGMLKWAKPDVKLMLNSDHPHIDPWYEENAEAWAQLIDVSTRYYQDAGYEVVSVAPFNEPDYGWSQWVPGSQDGNEGRRKEGFRLIAEELRKNPRFDNIRICGGNTLNCDQALPWYNYLKDQLDEGNTHQLAGSFDNFAQFFTTVREDGKHATADEMHNVMEAMVGLEYGLQTGVWWGSAEYTRGEFCKASHGERLAYAEHRPNWTAASVYRAPDGRVQAFAGMSERQGVTTTYRFVSEERDVFFNGHGPQREYVVELPGGEPGSYQNGQTNAECVVNITWGEDIQPVVDGTYMLLNKDSRRLLDVANGSPSASSYSTGKRSLQWQVKPVDASIGGDFSYHQIVSGYSFQTLDVLNWSMNADTEIILYTNNRGSNQQWVLEYAGDGWFRIRSRHSALYLCFSGNKLIQTERDEASDAQLWRFVPTGIRPAVRDVDAPTGLTAEGRASSVGLTWNSVDASHPTYTVLRSETPDNGYEIIARDVEDTAFVDNKAEAGTTYYYKVKAVDASLNSSPASAQASAAASGANDLVTRYEFEENTNDTTCNLYRAATFAEAVFDGGHSGNYALELDGDSQFVQLPTTLANHERITVATWLYWRGGSNEQRLFDFGRGEDECMYLEMRARNGLMCFTIKKGDEEQTLEGVRPLTYRNKWIHLALTMDDGAVCLHLNGEPVASSADITLRPSDLRPFLNYIGRSQAADTPLFYGLVDDFRIYNYALDADEIKSLWNNGTGICGTPADTPDRFELGPLPADTRLDVQFALAKGAKDVRFSVYDLQGHLVTQQNGKNGGTTTIGVEQLPDGMYVLKAQCGPSAHSRKFTVRHP